METKKAVSGERINSPFVSGGVAGDMQRPITGKLRTGGDKQVGIFTLANGAIKLLGDAANVSQSFSGTTIS